jgi:hypothetical protein
LEAEIIKNGEAIAVGYVATTVVMMVPHHPAPYYK